LRYGWPGNVRELLHVLEQSVALCEGTELGIEDLPPAFRAPVKSPDVTTKAQVLTLREAERQHFFSVLAGVGGNRAKAARLLGLTERTFYRLLEKYRRPSPPENREEQPASGDQRA